MCSVPVLSTVALVFGETENPGKTAKLSSLPLLTKYTEKWSAIDCSNFHHQIKFFLACSDLRAKQNKAKSLEEGKVENETRSYF